MELEIVLQNHKVEYLYENERKLTEADIELDVKVYGILNLRGFKIKYYLNFR